MMKKVLMIALLCALFAGISPAEAQVRFGVKGGMNLTSLSFEKDDYTIRLWIDKDTNLNLDKDGHYHGIIKVEESK